MRTSLSIIAIGLALSLPIGCNSSSDDDSASGSGASSGSGSSTSSGSGGSTNSGSGGSAGSSGASSGSGSGGTSSGGSSGGGASSGGSGGSGNSGPGAIPEEWRTCEVDADCVIVPQNSCCGCMPFGVNEEYEDETSAEFAKFNAAECPPLGCPSFPCPPDPVPICSDGVCSWTPGCSARSEADCATDGECAPYMGRPCGQQDPVFVTCGRLKACPAVVSCATGPSGIQYAFASCTPDGYTPCALACE